MKIKSALKIITLVVLFLAVVAYLIYAFFGMKSTNPDEQCVEVAVIMEDGPDAFVDSTMVIEMLKQNGIDPIGKKMRDVNTQTVKSIIEKNPFVVAVECYQTNNGMEVGQGKLCVKVTQRIPVMLVFDNKSSYYVDSFANVIKTDSIYARNILVANGEISQNYLSELVQLAQYIKMDEFWDNQIEQIYVSFNKMNEREITLIPRVGSQKILLGTIEKYDKKLKRLKVFYERGINKIGWNKYSMLNLEYDNQVVGIIKGKEIVIAKEEDEGKQQNDGTQQNAQLTQTPAQQTAPANNPPAQQTQQESQPKPAEQTQPAEQKPAEQQPAEQKTAEQKSAQQPAEQKKTE